jgi:hypothetical protein
MDRSPDGCERGPSLRSWVQVDAVEAYGPCPHPCLVLEACHSHGSPSSARAHGFSCCALNPELKLRRGDDAAQTSTKLYLILDFVNGGHLFFQLYRQVRGLDDKSCRSLSSVRAPKQSPSVVLCVRIVRVNQPPRQMTRSCTPPGPMQSNRSRALCLRCVRGTRLSALAHPQALVFVK